jgi:hypothetical protein
VRSRGATMISGSSDRRIAPRGPMVVPFAEAKGASVVQREDGLWAIGWHDDARGLFETREFAEAVARELAP